MLEGQLDWLEKTATFPNQTNWPFDTDVYKTEQEVGRRPNRILEVTNFAYELGDAIEAYTALRT